MGGLGTAGVPHEDVCGKPSERDARACRCLPVKKSSVPLMSVAVDGDHARLAALRIRGTLQSSGRVDRNASHQHLPHRRTTTAIHSHSQNLAVAVRPAAKRGVKAQLFLFPARLPGGLLPDGRL